MNIIYVSFIVVVLSWKPLFLQDYIKNALDVSINANNPYEMTSIGDEDNAPLITLEQNATRNANDIMVLYTVI